MNQILSVEMPKSKSGSYRNRSSNKADTKTIIIVFCIILIIFALIVAIISFKLLNKNPKENPGQNPVITGTQPKIDVEIQDTTVNVIITHDKQISSIVYDWNGGEKIEQTDIGETTKEIQVEIPAGTNTLNVSVTDINGVTQNYSNQYTGEQVEVQGPSIILERIEDGIKLTAQSNVEIAYISYNWDGEEETQIQINDTKTEQMIEAIEGKNTLNVVLVDKNGQETTATKTIIGDYKPTLKVTTDNVNLFIEASDDEGLTKMTVLIYNGETKEFEINNTQFNTTIPLQDGDNRFIITVYNVNGLENEQRARVVK